MNTRSVIAELAKSITMSGAEITLIDEKNGPTFEMVCRDANFGHDSLNRSISICHNFLRSAVSTGMKVITSSDQKQLNPIDSSCVVSLHSNMRQDDYRKSDIWKFMDTSIQDCSQYQMDDALLRVDQTLGNISQILMLMLLACLVLLLLASGLQCVVDKCKARNENGEREPLLANVQHRQPYSGGSFRLGDVEGAAPVAVVVQQQQGEQQEGEREPGRLAP